MGAWILFILFKEGGGENHDFMFMSLFSKTLNNHGFMLGFEDIERHWKVIILC